MNVHLTPLTHITPTLAIRLKACPLQVACDRDSLLQSSIVKGTGARLGTICHRVLEAVGRQAIAPDANWDTAFEVLWNAEIAKMKATLSSRESHLENPERWPNYAMRRGWTKHTAHNLWKQQRERPIIAINSQPKVMFEQPYEAFGKRMRGTADVVHHAETGVIIEDYKSGAIIEASSEGQASVVRESYRQQIILYAAMHYDTTGVWPTHGRLIPLNGEPLDVAVNPQEASDLADTMLASLDDYNRDIQAGVSADALARPNSEICKWCSYQGVCNAVWQTITPEWQWSLHIIEGVVIMAYHAPRGQTIADIKVIRGSIPGGVYRIQTDIPFCSDTILHAQEQLLRITHLRRIDARLVTTSSSSVWLVPAHYGDSSP